MRMFVTGVKDGKSCIVREIDAEVGGDQLMFPTLLDLSLQEPSTRATGSAPFHEVSLPAQTLRWLRVYFPPNYVATMHHTDSIDWNTVVTGSTELLLDDGPHKVEVGDSFVVDGVDHGWRAGPEGCTMSIVMIPLPSRAS